MDIPQYSDIDLYHKCKKLGLEIFKHRNLFILLIPEVYKRKLYKKYRFASIHQFAAKLGGLSHSHVNKIINLDRRLNDKPKLKSLLYSGTVGWSKIYTIANIATPDTDEYWSKQIITLNKSALETLRKDLKAEKSIYKGPSFENLNIKLSKENLRKLHSLKAKHKANTWNELFEILLNSDNKLPDKKTTKRAKRTSKTTRYIPLETKKIILESTNYLCSDPECLKPIQELHHQIPYSISQNHDSLTGLCKDHHNLMHHKEDTDFQINFINSKFKEYKKSALNLVQDG